MEKEVAYILVRSFFDLAMASILMGLVYLIGWRHSPRWKARFWWVTFALAGTLGLFIGSDFGNDVAIGICFWIIAALVYLWRRQKWRSRQQAKV